MKVIIAGSTGLVGTALIKHCIKDKNITSIVALSRRELPSDLTESSEKLKIVIFEDFLEYSEEVIQELTGAEACLWALGGKVGTQFPDVETARKVSIDYTVTAANTFAKKILPANRDRGFKFVFCSGMLAERDLSKSLYFMSDTRRIKGEVETELIDIEAKHQAFKTYIIRPGRILPEDANATIAAVLGSVIPTVKVTELAAVMVEIGLNGCKQQTSDNADIITIGSRVLK